MAGIREALEAAYDEHAEEEAPAGIGKPAGVQAQDPPEVKAAPVPSAPEPKKEATKEPANAATSKTSVKPAETEVPKQGVQPQAKTEPALQAQPDSRAPVSWKPEVREKFGALPPEVKAEVMRRETEVQGALRESADARRFYTEFNKVSAPYAALFASENTNPVAAAADLYRSAYVLRSGTPQVKANMVAQLITQFGIDINLLDTVLSGHIAGKPPVNDPTVQYLNQALAPVHEFIREQRTFRQTEQEKSQAQLQQELDAFANDPKNEFFSDIQGDVADILELSAKRGQSITLQDAYTRATMLHPEISKVIERRKASEKAAQQTAAARKARQAGASVSSGAPSQSEEAPRVIKGNRRSAIEAAWETVEAARQ